MIKEQTLPQNKIELTLPALEQKLEDKTDMLIASAKEQKPDLEITENFKNFVSALSDIFVLEAKKIEEQLKNQSLDKETISDLTKQKNLLEDNFRQTIIEVGLELDSFLKN